ncbi:patatin-like protein 1 [Prosopis cineraria]|uniref:patatin-like protein 1 n=1 Tax=Prosopis cineraria TaxID=364024 RepID=UPI00240F50AA|nr:patatin-like protein 1 [Prosopis cineraria]
MAKLPPSAYGKVVTILSIDGGGVRGIIPAIILRYLEEQLQIYDENARIADYFDVIAGTSTGGLVTSLLTIPDKSQRPKYTAQDIVDLYKNEAKRIFPEPSLIRKIEVFLNKPKYDGKYLHGTIENKLKDTKLHETVTNVVIPTFDMKQVRPVIFSSFELETIPYIDAKLSDICIGTSAAPTYLPPYYFSNDGKEFNLIDGGVIANNPALVAISEIIEQKKKGNTECLQVDPNDYSKIYLVSLGTGIQKPNTDYDARAASNWGMLAWASGPLTELTLDGSQDMVDYHLASVFQALGSNNYLRIQTDQLSGDMARMDNSTDKNMKDLEKLANQILEQRVTRLDLPTFEFKEVPDAPTNKQALQQVAEFLHKEKQERQKQVAF